VFESAIKNSEECAKLGVSFWCASEKNMKQCGVDKIQCKRMKASEVATDLTENAAASGATGTEVDSIRKQRLQKAKKKNSKTGATGSGSATGGATAASNGDKLKGAAAATGMATGPSARKASSSTGAALSKKQKHDDFMKLLKIFDQNKDQRIGWDEIIAVTGHSDPKMKREFQMAAGNDMKMDYKEFHNFMNKEDGAKFFFM
jgi:hypothetical protein